MIQVNVLGPHVELEEVGICQSVVVQMFSHDDIVKEKLYLCLFDICWFLGG